VEPNRRFGRRDRPTVKQIYALCAALCERHGEQFPESRVEASELIERIHIENGHPSPSLSGTRPDARLERPDRLRY
jgi:hypothetical protein